MPMQNNLPAVSSVSMLAVNCLGCRDLRVLPTPRLNTVPLHQNIVREREAREAALN
jgi:hypothetical protein